jgi:hypothetical protein
MSSPVHRRQPQLGYEPLRSGPRRAASDGYSAFIPHRSRRIGRTTIRIISSSRNFAHARVVGSEEARLASADDASRAFAGLFQPTAGLEPASPSLRASTPPSLYFGSARFLPAGHSASAPRVIPYLFRIQARQQRVQPMVSRAADDLPRCGVRPESAAVDLAGEFVRFEPATRGVICSLRPWNGPSATC